MMENDYMPTVKDLIAHLLTLPEDYKVEFDLADGRFPMVLLDINLDHESKSVLF